MSDNYKIIERVKKLLAMASDASSPNEAAIAARRARKLMDEHQISKLDLESVDDSAFGEYKAGRDSARMPKWQQWLLISVARLNDCIAVRERGSITFKGFYSDAVIAGSMYQYLILSARRLCDLRSVAGRSNRHFYFVGFAHAVSDRIDLMIYERDAYVQSESCKSLVIQKKALVESHFGPEDYSKPSSVRAPSGYELAAFGLGGADGKSASVSPGLDGDSAVLIGSTD